MERESVPSGVTLFRMMDAYGPEFLAFIAPKQMGWISEAARAARQAELEAQQQRIAAEPAELRQ